MLFNVRHKESFTNGTHPVPINIFEMALYTLTEIISINMFYIGKAIML